ncbi:MAG TPA: MBL fold metallo-hydrolase [Rubricoccaceae bacterium]
MTLTFWGAAQTVTGSLHLLELDDGTRLMLDCGLFQGHRADAERINREWPADPASVHAVLLSHAHIDHSGRLPQLVKDGFTGTIWATHATRDLCALMLRDSAHIQTSDAERVNKKRKKRGEPEVVPLYDETDAEQAVAQVVGVPYGFAFEPAPGVRVVYRDAGHILGSATMTIDVTENGEARTLGFTGDLGNPGRPILRDPEPLPPVDWLISESTYGGETHEPATDARERLRAVVARTAARGGRVVVPAFAVGRTQELVYALDRLENEGRLPDLPVFVDSPLAVNATSIFQSHPECYDADVLQTMLTDPNPFGFGRLEYVREADRSKELNAIEGPFVVISASGMAEAGRILHHLRNTVEDPRHTVLVVGFMAEHTLGRRIAERQPEVKIFGETYQLRAEVEVLSAFSAHADEPGLLGFIGALDRERLQAVFLVHGETDRMAALTASLGGIGIGDVRAPARGETVRLT